LELPHVSRISFSEPSRALLASGIKEEQMKLSMPEPVANILFVYSRDGSVEALAKAVGEGAHEAGAEIRLRRVPDIVSSAPPCQYS
jgi:hypothetical protein